ncbi:prepilin peptidase [Campylobacter sp. RM12327]|nr:prepilin peptidase [Campylobacter sp. RM11302]MBF6669285.1 prepilin peptidase [Campylobacter sp. RM12327]MBF6674553.1 prepilin peptidase [Campylobacter sp. RM13538]MBF6676658.1 prepilin peptidase [Campylobacter sp. RM12321]MBF6677151.1 prepilin peptidase [Campylobacter sp. RM11259]
MIVIWVLFFIFGAVIGSFGNVLIYRIPLKQSVVFPASHCLKCNKKLKFYHNIPIISWIFLRGKCAFCKNKISFVYPLVEFVSGILMVLAYFYVYEIFNSFMLGVCFIILFCLSIIDFKIKMVPENLLLFAYVFAILSNYDRDLIAYHLINLNLYGTFFVDSLILAGAIIIIKTIVSVIKNRGKIYDNIEVMGDADTIIIAIIGAILGIKMGIIAIILACIFMLPFFMYFILVKKQSDIELAMIPFLFLGLIFTYIFKSEIINLISLYYNYIQNL